MSLKFAARRIPAGKLELAIVAATLAWGVALETKDTTLAYLAQLQASPLWRWLRRALLIGGGWAFLAWAGLVSR